jgi:Microcystin-dependent protein
MAWPKILQMLFNNGGKGPSLRNDIIPDASRMDKGGVFFPTSSEISNGYADDGREGFPIAMPLSAISGQFDAPGTAKFFVGQYPPKTLRLADGQLLNYANFPDAGEQLGNQFGGDGVTTFGLPDMRSEPPTSGGHWYIFIGEDVQTTGRFYCGVGVYCGDPGLYPGATISV